ncbi:hypothetical protein L4D20_23880 [Vibrio kyushuensis]|uniref:hypothetical protein n=1 Tax=Vibrio kyushuensis TaxID=2910249 RepID=UPI003D0FA967
MDDLYRWREDYVKNAAPLMIWHVWQLARHTENPVSPWDALDRYADIYRLSTRSEKIDPTVPGFSDPEWDELKRRIIAIFEKHVTTLDSQALEAECMALLWPLMKVRIKADSRPHPPRAHGSWLRDIDGQFIKLHISNAALPNSPFDDKLGMASDLLRLLLDTKAEHPSVTHVRCGTWLNNLPIFLSLFPPSWAASKSDVIELGRGLGLWGQYMDRTGAFHSKNAQTFRATGRHPFFYVTCHCEYSEAIAHLERMKVIGDTNAQLV